MLLILEGPDKVGKTTLALRLAADLGWPYYHCDKPQKGQGREHVWQEYVTLKRAAQAGVDLVVDRYAWSEMVYGRIFRGTRIDFTLLKELTAGLPAFVLKCFDSVDNIVERVKADGEWYSAEDVQKLVTLFDTAFEDPSHRHCAVGHVKPVELDDSLYAGILYHVIKLQRQFREG